MMQIGKQSIINKGKFPLRKCWITSTERILCVTVLLLVLLAGLGTAVDDEENLTLEGDFGSSTYRPETETSSGLVMLAGIIVVTVIVIHA